VLWNRTRLIIALAMLGFVLIALACSLDIEGVKGITYRIILPDRFEGWIRVDLGVDSAAPLDYQNIAIIDVGEDGRFRTSSSMVLDVSKTTYEFYYRVNGQLKPVPDALVVRDFNAGGMTAMATDYDQNVKPLSWYFFVGNMDYRLAHPNKIFIESGSEVLPRPGRLEDI
jgi:hypothetical protein